MEKNLAINERNIERYEKIDKILIILAYLMLFIPVALLLTFWFKWYISITCLTLLSIAQIFVIKSIKTKTIEEYEKIFNKKKLIIIAILVLILNLLSGAGGIGFQNWDYKGRNAILHDLINHSWPVKYDYSNEEYETNKIGADKGFMSYYFAYWLPGALVGKITGFKAASLFMFIWQLIGSWLFFYLIFRKLNNVKIKYFIIFLCFGGLDIITRIIMNKWTGTALGLLGESHIDTANGTFCMSTFITQLFWVFNQSIPAWLATVLLINDQSYKNIGVLVALLLPFSPFPCIGLILLAIILIFVGFDFNSKINLQRIKDLISLQNIMAVISVIPIGLLFMQNSSGKGWVFMRAYQNGNLQHTIIEYILFLILEFGIYSIILTKENKKRVLTYFALFAILPTFYIGGGMDLGNRATIPMLILLYIEILRFIDNIEVSKKRIIILYIILLIAFCTNFNEIYRSLKYSYPCWKEKSFMNFNDAYLTFDEFKDKECDSFITNFVAPQKNNYFSHILR